MPAYEEISYTLAEDEIVKALKISGYYSYGSKKMMIQTILLGVMFIFFLINFFLNYEWFNLAMAIVCVIVTGFLYLLPIFDMKKNAKLAEKKIRFRLYPTAIYYYGPEHTLEISLKQAKIKISNKNEMIAIMPQESGLLSIPFRCLPKERKAKILHDLLQYAD
ncbi:hypothetical protein [Scatolibacter rhodanostii]|uniref:hypothetical protein n=1 Tax=Scatolibacter rhodanostii TaxID=2014781 RepID=UPI000C07E1BD|nr:hypothetical protein [Scatolibacter rhodanostii]